MENRDALPLKSNQIDTGAGRQMFGFGRKAGITDQETWTLVIRVAVKMTAEEESTKQVVGMQKAKAILEAECKNLRLRPTTEQREYIEAGMHGLSSTTLTCKRRSKTPSLKRPGSPVAPE